MSNDLLGEKTALEQTRAIINSLDDKLPPKLYKKLVRQIYSNQLIKFTNLNRFERHKRINELFQGEKKR